MEKDMQNAIPFPQQDQSQPRTIVFTCKAYPEIKPLIPKSRRQVIKFVPMDKECDEAHVLVHFPVGRIKDVPAIAKNAETHRVIKFQSKRHVVRENPIRIDFTRAGWEIVDGVNRFLGAFGRNDDTVPALIPIRALGPYLNNCEI
jgi:hypothetical protein